MASDGPNFTVVGDLVGLQRGTTYKSRLLGLPGPVLLGLASIRRNGGFRRDKLRTYGGESPEKLLVHPGDLYVSLKDVTQAAHLLGSVARVPPDVMVGRLTQDTVRLVVRPGKDGFVDYLYWALRTPQYRGYCRSRATGTTNLGLAREDFLSFPLPPLSGDRSRLVQVLQACEDKIENNRKLNQTLEAMAQALFRSWFVDFEPVIDNALRAGNPIPDNLVETAERRRLVIDRDPYSPSEYDRVFPDGFEVGEAGALPRGWRSVPFADAGKWVSGGTPSKKEAGYWGGDIPWFSAKSLGPLWLTDSPRRVTAAGAQAGTRLVPRGTLLFVVRGMSLAKELRVGLTTRAATLNQDLKGIVDDGTVVPELLLLWMLTTREEIRGQADEAGHGTKRLPTPILHSFRLPLPPRASQDRMMGPLRSLLQLSASNAAESATLATLRDTLLPRLLPGEGRAPGSRDDAGGRA